MFTGIIQDLGIITSLRDGGGLAVQSAEIAAKLNIGESVAVNGTCLTVVEVTANYFSVDIVPETFKRTNLGCVQCGDMVNLETALIMGDGLGGHLVQGHVDGLGTVKEVKIAEASHVILIETDLAIMKYVVEKGFIAVDGISLTVAAESPTQFSIAVIPHTYEHTTLQFRSVGQTVNLEVDILAKYVERLSAR
ncbi:MAG: riboflavin synthase [Dehalococcoidia bacterium]|nr:riboflavin synthase [Dehalococcoidia bacterium]